MKMYTIWHENENNGHSNLVTVIIIITVCLDPFFRTQLHHSAEEYERKSCSLLVQDHCIVQIQEQNLLSISIMNYGKLFCPLLYRNSICSGGFEDFISSSNLECMMFLG